MVDSTWLRRQLGIVLQENILFNRSIRDNIALAEPGMPIERVIAAATLAGAHDFILELPEGYDTDRRRTRQQPVGRPAPAHCDCARSSERAAHSDFR